MNTSILENIGFTKGEVKVYLALLELGNTSSGKIIHRSNISRSKVYDVLERLKEKGLVTESIKDNTRYFEATSPKKILEYIKRKENDLKDQLRDFDNLLPSLIEKQKSLSNKQEVKIYVGQEGLRSFYKEILDKLSQGDEYLVITKESKYYEDENYVTFIKNIHEKRLSKKAKVKVLFNSLKGSFKHKDLFKNQLPYYELREIPIHLPTGLVVFRDTVSIMTWGETVRVFVIICKEVADQYKEFFYDLWKVAK